MTEDNVMKIADFGLARDIHHIDYYKKTTNVSAEDRMAMGPLPRTPSGFLLLHLWAGAQHRWPYLRGGGVGRTKHMTSFPHLVPCVRPPTTPPCRPRLSPHHRGLGYPQSPCVTYRAGCL